MAEGDAVLPDMYTSVILVDRAMRGGCEIVYDGVRVVFKSGQIEKPVPFGIAVWLFQTDKERVHTTSGEYVLRFGIKDPSDELLQALGPDCGNCDPIEIDTTRIERWDVESHAQRGGTRKVVTVSRDPSDNSNLAAAGAASFGQER